MESASICVLVPEGLVSGSALAAEKAGFGRACS